MRLGSSFSRLRFPLELLIIILISSGFTACCLGWCFGHDPFHVLFDWSMHIVAIGTHVVVAEIILAELHVRTSRHAQVI